MAVLTDGLTEQLRAGNIYQDAHIQAAVELIIAHDSWLRRKDFVDAVVHIDDGMAVIRWDLARKHLTDGDFNRSSSSARAILDIALTLAENKFLLSTMGIHHGQIILAAFTRALQNH